MMAMQGEAGAVLAPQVPLANDRAGVEELHDLRTIVRERSWVEARRDIFSEGEIPNELRIVVRGLACRYKIMMDGSRRIIGFIFPGDACNADLLCIAEMDHGVRTIIRTEIVSVTRDKLLELMQVNPAIARVFWSSIAQDTAILRQWLVKMGHQKAPGRVAHLLYEVFLRCQMVGAATSDTCILQLTQDELADTLGLTPVHMNRVLQRLRKEGLIQLVGRRLTILDQQGLAAAADFDPKYHRALRRTPLGVQLGLRPPDRVAPSA
jgi:CRP-like cAMP-binding protein